MEHISTIIERKRKEYDMTGFIILGLVGFGFMTLADYIKF